MINDFSLFNINIQYIGGRYAHARTRTHARTHTRTRTYAHAHTKAPYSFTIQEHHVIKYTSLSENCMISTKSVQFYCMVILYGKTVWSNCMVKLYGITVW